MDYIGLNVIITVLLEVNLYPRNFPLKIDYIMHRFILVHAYLKIDTISSYCLRDYRIKIYAIESTPRGRPVYKD